MLPKIIAKTKLCILCLKLKLVIGCYRWRELVQLVGREGEEEERQAPVGKEMIMISSDTEYEDIS